MQQVVVDGVATPLGARVAALIDIDVDARRVDIGGTDLVVLASGTGGETDGSTLGGVDLDAAITVLVSPVEDVVGEDVGTHAECGHPPELCCRRHLAVLQGVAVIPSGMSF